MGHIRPYPKTNKEKIGNSIRKSFKNKTTTTKLKMDKTPNH